MSAAAESLRFTGLFESELLVELMLQYWNHPHADDESFRNALLESAAEVLRASIGGHVLLDEVAPPNMNLVSAIWYTESLAVQSEADIPMEERSLRDKWLETVRRAVPSCFCNPDRLM